MPFRGGGSTPNSKYHLKFPFWLSAPLPKLPRPNHFKIETHQKDICFSALWKSPAGKCKTLTLGKFPRLLPVRHIWSSAEEILRRPEIYDRIASLLGSWGGDEMKAQISQFEAQTFFLCKVNISSGMQYCKTKHLVGKLLPQKCQHWYTYKQQIPCIEKNTCH